jgi:hypothetical protein
MILLLPFLAAFFTKAVMFMLPAFVHLSASLRRTLVLLVKSFSNYALFATALSDEAKA